MPVRATFRNPLTGRFVSEESAGALEQAIRTVYTDGEVTSEQVLSFGQVQEQVSGSVQNWQQESSRWGERWHGVDEDGNSADIPLDLYGLSQTPFPEGFDSYKVWYFVEGNPDYPGGYATGRPAWLGADQWPPDMGQQGNFTPTGISQIVFRRG